MHIADNFHSTLFIYSRLTLDDWTGDKQQVMNATIH